MNHNGEEFSERVAADLDRFADMSTDHLHDAVSREGLCQWLYTSGNAPVWSGDDQADRVTAARICAGCPVAGECLEFELRTAGYATAGVWGPAGGRGAAAGVPVLDTASGRGCAMNLNLTPEHLLAGIGVLLGLLWVWRAGTRRARAAADTARSGVRLVSLFGRVVFTAGLIVGVQWIVITHPAANTWLLVAVLGLPTLFASYALTRALTVTTLDTPRRRGGGRR